MFKTDRKGIYKGKEYNFTHVNLRAREVYSPEIMSDVDGNYGTWVHLDSVKWIGENNKIEGWR